MEGEIALFAWHCRSFIGVVALWSIMCGWMLLWLVHRWSAACCCILSDEGRVGWGTGFLHPLFQVQCPWTLELEFVPGPSLVPWCNCSILYPLSHKVFLLFFGLWIHVCATSFMFLFIGFSQRCALESIHQKSGLLCKILSLLFWFNHSQKDSEVLIIAVCGDFD